VLNSVYPNVKLLTETNVPHAENIQYFGNGENEAQLVYQFSLPGLLIHSFLKGNGAKLTKWAESLALESESCTYFNLLASHDGIGIRPLLGILDDSEIENLTQTTLDRGGFVSYKNSVNKQKDAYELNITLFDILSNPDQSEDLNIQKFITAHAILLSMQGIPALYYHSLFASSGDHSGVKISGHYRSINRKKLDVHEIERQLSDPLSRTRIVFSELKRLIRIRKQHPAFHPYSSQKIHTLSNQLFCIERSSIDKSEKVLAIHNVSDELVEISIPETVTSNLLITAKNIITGDQINLHDPISIPPYGFVWIKTA